MNRCNPKERRMSILQTLNRELGRRKKLFKKREKGKSINAKEMVLPYCGAFAKGCSQPISSFCFATVLKKQSAKERRQFLFK